MNDARVHLLLNHIPVIGALFGIAVLLGGIVKQSSELKKAGFVIFVGIALIAVPVFRSGHPAEEIVEDMPGVSERVIETHEDAAKKAMIAVEITGILALISLAASRGSQNTPGSLVALLLAASLATGGLMAKTASLGGKIRHTEIRTGFKSDEKNEEKEKYGHNQKKHKEKGKHEEPENPEMEKLEHGERK